MKGGDCGESDEGSGREEGTVGKVMREVDEGRGLWGKG